MNRRYVSLLFVDTQFFHKFMLIRKKSKNRGKIRQNYAYYAANFAATIIAHENEMIVSRWLIELKIISKWHTWFAVGWIRYLSLFLSLSDLSDIRKNVPGEPGIDYPAYTTLPQTGFTCEGRSRGKYTWINYIVGSLHMPFPLLLWHVHRNKKFFCCQTQHFYYTRMKSSFHSLLQNWKIFISHNTMCTFDILENEL